MNADFSQNFFALFGLPAAFSLDRAALDDAYRAMQRQTHPDRFAQADAARQRAAEQWAAHINEAYRTLKSPLARARYLLMLNGVDTAEETDTSMPVDFLMQQMEWRESAERARRQGDADALAAVDAACRSEETALFDLLAQQLAAPSTLPAAASTVRKLRFLEKLTEELEQAHDALAG